MALFTADTILLVYAYPGPLHDPLHTEHHMSNIPYRHPGRGLQPSPVVQGIPVDRTGVIAILHRSDKVPSAKNCWSFPSGIHEVGETGDKAITRELGEELNLQVTRRPIFVGAYENLGSVDDPYHWLVQVFVCRSEFSWLKNLEPDKHDRVELMHWTDLVSGRYKTRFDGMGPGLADFVHSHRKLLTDAFLYLQA